MVLRLQQNQTEKIEQIYKLFNKYSKEVGFVLKPSIIQSAINGEVFYIEQDNKIVAAVKFHKRKDGFVTIYEIVVDKDYRGKGLARELLAKVSYFGAIRLKCPIDNESNNFYKKMGFELIKIEKGRKRDLNVWLASGVRYQSSNIQNGGVL